jgi:hypothetical protein
MGLRALALMATASATACVVPIPVEFDGLEPDAGRNDHPSILRAVPDDFPGPLNLNPDSPQEYTVTIADNDVDDTLYVRVFRNYHLGALGPLLDRPVPNNPMSGAIERTTVLPSNTWCNAVTPGSQIVIEVVVADRPFDDDPTKEPAYQVTEGHKDKSWWNATCPLLP